MARILVCDDNSKYGDSLRDLLGFESYSVKIARSVVEATRLLDAESFNIVLTDLRLSNDADERDLSGLQVAKLAREHDSPCIVLTAYPSVEAARTALRSPGREPLAVDFIDKSDSPQTILGLIGRLLTSTQTEKPAPDRLQHGIYIDTRQDVIMINGQPVDLPLQQRRLLVYLYSRAGELCSRTELLKAVYGEDVSEKHAAEDRRLEQLVDRLRKAIEEDSHDPRYLLTDSGGFRLAAQP